MARSIETIAREALKDMAANSNVPVQQRYGAAWPYLRAMHSLNTLSDNYGLDNAKSIVRYFLANAGTWRGETARRVKKELNDMLAAAS